MLGGTRCSPRIDYFTTANFVLIHTFFVRTHSVKSWPRDQVSMRFIIFHQVVNLLWFFEVAKSHKIPKNEISYFCVEFPSSLLSTCKTTHIQLPLEISFHFAKGPIFLYFFFYQNQENSKNHKCATWVAFPAKPSPAFLRLQRGLGLISMRDRWRTERSSLK